MDFRKSEAQVKSIDNTTLFNMIANSVKNVKIVKNAEGTKKIFSNKKQTEKILRNKKIRDRLFELSHNNVELLNNENYLVIEENDNVIISQDFVKEYFYDFPFCPRLEYKLIKKELNEGKMEEFARRNPEDVFNCFSIFKSKNFEILVPVIKQYVNKSTKIDPKIQTKFVELYFDRVRRNVMCRNGGEKYFKTEICALLLGLLGQNSKMRILEKFNSAIVDADESMNEELSGKLLGILLKKFNKMEKNERKNILKFLNTNTKNGKICNIGVISNFLYKKNRKKSFFRTHKVSAEEEGQDLLSTTKIRRDEIKMDYSRFYRLPNELPEDFWPEPLPGPIPVNSSENDYICPTNKQISQQQKLILTPPLSIIQSPKPTPPPSTTRQRPIPKSKQTSPSTEQSLTQKLQFYGDSFDNNQKKPIKFIFSDSSDGAIEQKSYDYYSENDDLIEHSSDLSELIGDFTPARSKDH